MSNCWKSHATAYIIVCFHFREGSIEAFYIVIISADKVESAVSYIKNSVEDTLVNATIAGRNVNEAYTKDAMETAISQDKGKHQTFEVQYGQHH